MPLKGLPSLHASLLYGPDYSSSSPFFSPSKNIYITRWAVWTFTLKEKLFSPAIVTLLLALLYYSSGVSLAQYIDFFTVFY